MARWRQDQPIVDREGRPTREFMVFLEELLVRRNVWVDDQPHPDPELNDIWIATEE